NLNNLLHGRAAASLGSVARKVCDGARIPNAFAVAEIRFPIGQAGGGSGVASHGCRDVCCAPSDSALRKRRNRKANKKNPGAPKHFRYRITRPHFEGVKIGSTMLLRLAIMLAFAAVSFAQAPRPAAAKPDARAALIQDLVIANHILANEGVVD